MKRAVFQQGDRFINDVPGYREPLARGDGMPKPIHHVYVEPRASG